MADDPGERVLAAIIGTECRLEGRGKRPPPLRSYETPAIAMSALELERLA